MKTIKLVFLIIVLSMFTCVLFAQQEDKGLGKGQIHNNSNNNQGGNQDGNVKKETKGGVDVDKKQENPPKDEQKGNVKPDNQQNENNKTKQEENQKNDKAKTDVDKQEKAQDKETDKVEKQENEQNKKPEENNNGQHKGNAYGKEKDGMSGREFGELRSEEAKSKVNTKIDDAVTELDTEYTKVKNMKKDIDDSKIRNEEKYKSKLITKEQYEINKIKISEAEIKVNETEQKLVIERENLKNAKLELK